MKAAVAVVRKLEERRLAALGESWEQHAHHLAETLRKLQETAEREPSRGARE